MDYRELNVPLQELEANKTIFPSSNFIIRYYLAEEGVETLEAIKLDSSWTGNGVFLYEAGSYPASKASRWLKYPVCEIQVKYYDASEDKDPRAVADLVTEALDNLRNIRYGRYLIKRCFVEQDFGFYEQQDTLLVYKATFYMQLIDLKKQAEQGGHEYIPSEIEENGLFLF